MFEILEHLPYPCSVLFSYLIRPSSLSPKPSPLIDERKLFHSQQRRFEREEPTGADNSELAHVDSTTKKIPGGRIVKDGNNRVCNKNVLETLKIVIIIIIRF